MILKIVELALNDIKSITEEITTELMIVIKKPLLLFYFILGFTFGFPAVALEFFLIDDLKMDPAVMTALFGIVSLPWCIKPAMGLWSDTFSICGYHRVPYICIGSFLSGVSWWCLPYFTDYIGTVLFLGSFFLCLADVCCDCILVQLARLEDENHKGEIQSWAWGVRAAGALAASIIGPACYSWFGPQITFVSCGCMPIIFSALALFLKEDNVKNVDEETTGVGNIKKLFAAFKTKRVLLPAIFIFIINVTPGFGSVLTYWLQHVLHFTPYNFATLDVAGGLASIAGSIIYQKFLTNVKLRRLFIYALTIAFFLRWSHIIMVSRVAPGMDVIFAISEQVAMTLVSQCILLPVVCLVAKICPKGIEGSLYALIMSISNFGGTLSSEWSAVMASALGITSSNFDNFITFIIICNVLAIIPIAATKLVNDDEEGPRPLTRADGVEKLAEESRP